MRMFFQMTPTKRGHFVQFQSGGLEGSALPKTKGDIEKLLKYILKLYHDPPKSTAPFISPDVSEIEFSPTFKDLTKGQ